MLNKMNKITANYGFSEYSAEELFNMPFNEIPTLWDPFLPKTGLACLAGGSDVGKSSFLRQFALSIVAGNDEFLGYQLSPERHRVLYISTEDDVTSISVLLKKQNKIMNIPLDNLRNLQYVFGANNQDIIDYIDARLTNYPVDVVIIDCFSDVFLGDLNNMSQIRPCLSRYKQLVTVHDCLFLFLHHCTKRADGMAPSKHNLVGSQSFEADMRTVLELRSGNTPYEKTICAVKGNYLKPEYKGILFKLSFDSNQLYENSGLTVPLSLSSRTSQEEKKKQKKQEAQALIDDGLTYEQAAVKMGYKSRSSISHLFD